MSTRSFFVVVVHASMVQISFYMYLHIVQVQVCYKSHPGSLTYYTKGAIMTKGIIRNNNLEWQPDQGIGWIFQDWGINIG